MTALTIRFGVVFDQSTWIQSFLAIYALQAWFMVDLASRSHHLLCMIREFTARSASGSCSEHVVIGRVLILDVSRRCMMGMLEYSQGWILLVSD